VRTFQPAKLRRIQQVANLPHGVYHEWRTWEYVMFDANVLTFREFMRQESLPLATIQSAVLEFLRDRDDVVLFGAQAVNAYVGEPRMTQGIDLLSPRALEFAQELRGHLSERF